MGPLIFINNIFSILKINGIYIIYYHEFHY